MNTINLKKINLSKKGDMAELPVHNLHCQLRWTAPVDLDFHAYYRSKSHTEIEEAGALGKFFGKKAHEVEVEGEEDVVYFGERGSKKEFPFIYLDQDAGIGDVGGDNEENLYFIDLSVHEHILIVANIFNKDDDKFSSYDGKVIITVDGHEYTVPLTSDEPGSYCVIARIDNTSGTPKLINVNKTIYDEPEIEAFI